jgi:lipopolysaccharide/colanic/teichoic acid biosynthesis glycosyltransferase
MDIAGAIVGLFFTALITMIVGPIIYFTDPGPIFFAQVRIGMNGRKFKMYKFRSMYPDADKRLEELLQFNEMQGPAFKMENDPRITKVGHFIRKTSIDELPQLFNIIRGEMSIIGPRPPLPREVEQYTPYQLHRLDVKTGLACYHECQGRSDDKDFNNWVESDLKYIRERSMLTDIKVILWTIRVVLTGKGAM